MFKNLLLASVVVSTFFLIKTGNPVTLLVTTILFVLAVIFESNLHNQAEGSRNEKEVDTAIVSNLLLARICEISILLIGIMVLF